MTDVLPFSYGDSTVRTVMINGDPWFVAIDVAKALGMTSTSAASKIADIVDDDEKTTIHLVDSGQTGGPARVIINVPGLYRILMRSDKPEARQFQRWISHDVIPSIHKTGSYVAPVAEEPVGWLAAEKHMSAHTALELTQRAAERTARIYAVVREDLSEETRREISEYLIRVPVGLTKAQAELDRKITGTDNIIGIRAYLTARGVPRTQIVRWVGTFGGRVHAVYKEEYGCEAPIGQKAMGAAGRAERIYVEKDRFILDAVFQEFVALGRFIVK